VRQLGGFYRRHRVSFKDSTPPPTPADLQVPRSSTHIRCPFYAQTQFIPYNAQLHQTTPKTSTIMSRKLLGWGGVALAGAGGYYLYSAGGDPKLAEKKMERESGILRTCTNILT